MTGRLPEKFTDKRNMLLPIVCIRRQASSTGGAADRIAPATKTGFEGCRATDNC